MTTTPSTNVPAVADVVAALRHAPAESAPPARNGIIELLLGLHENNARQWEREDAARHEDADDHAVAHAKRDIDALNTKRHDFVEAIDGALAAMIDQSPSAPPTTESPGMVFDRLSVLVLRIASTEDAARGAPVDHERYAGDPTLRGGVSRERARAMLLVLTSFHTFEELRGAGLTLEEIERFAVSQTRELLEGHTPPERLASGHCAPALMQRLRTGQ